MRTFVRASTAPSSVHRVLIHVFIHPSVSIQSFIYPTFTGSLSFGQICWWELVDVELQKFVVLCSEKLLPESINLLHACRVRHLRIQMSGLTESDGDKWSSRNDASQLLRHITDSPLNGQPPVSGISSCWSKKKTKQYNPAFLWHITQQHNINIWYMSSINSPIPIIVVIELS